LSSDATVICKKMGGHPIICKCPFCLSVPEYVSLILG
jgi:hypothetical protein